MAIIVCERINVVPEAWYGIFVSHIENRYLEKATRSPSIRQFHHFSLIVDEISNFAKIIFSTSQHIFQVIHSNMTVVAYQPLSRHARTKFALFLKILMRQLEKSGEARLLAKVKALVLIVTRENRRSAFWNPMTKIDLVRTIEGPLRCLVGERHWRQAHVYMQLYFLKKNQRLTSVSYSGRS